MPFRRIAGVGLCLISLLLAGCGFRPLYATMDGGGVAASLASVAIPAANGRLEQMIRNDLMSAMRPVGTAAADRYTLTINPQRNSFKVINRPLPSVTRKSINLTVAYALRDESSGQVVANGKSFSQVSYDVVRQPFADLQAENDAVERAVHEVSADIRTRLAAYFAGHP